jgi:hypothetical protein
MKISILKDNRNYSFSDYFDLPNPTKEIVAAFGYTYALEKLDLPYSTLPEGALSSLKQTKRS